MKCEDALDTVYESEEIPFARRLALACHILFCSGCALRAGTYKEARSLLGGAFPPSPDFENAVMARIEDEAAEDEPAFDIPGGFSTRGWVIVGCIIFLSLSTLFFGSDFTSIAVDQGSSFLLPLGITIGIFLSGYGALFIGSHLKELQERFKL